MKNKILNEHQVKQAYMRCSMKNPDGLYADEVDLYELTDALLDAALPAAIREERKRCIEFVAARNADLARALKDARG